MAQSSLKNLPLRPPGDTSRHPLPWRPATLNASYWSLPALRGLATLTGDTRWQRLAAAAVSLTRRFTQGGRLLPPDWAELTAAGQLRPEPAPNGAVPQAQYGLDAQRTVVWFAAACDQQARALGARWWAKLKAGEQAQAIALRLNGGVINGSPSVLPLVAAASAAHAAILVPAQHLAEHARDLSGRRCRPGGSPLRTAATCSRSVPEVDRAPLGTGRQPLGHADPDTYAVHRDQPTDGHGTWSAGQ
jgi:hypothetical protein